MPVVFLRLALTLQLSRMINIWLVSNNLNLNKVLYYKLTLADPSIWIAARSAKFLLDVERATTTTTAQGVRLVVALAKRRGTFSLQINLKKTRKKFKIRTKKVKNNYCQYQVCLPFSLRGWERKRKNYEEAQRAGNTTHQAQLKAGRLYQPC